MAAKAKLVGIILHTLQNKLRPQLLTQLVELQTLTKITTTTTNNNEYLECLTCTGPKHLHILYILQIHIVKIQFKQHECTHTHTNPSDLYHQIL